MALTIKKTKSGLLIPKTTTNHRQAVNNVLKKYFSATEESIVTDQIKIILKEKLHVRGKVGVKKIEYFVTYQMDEATGEKQIGSIYMRHISNGLKDKMSADEIEITGVQLLEFFDYINTYGAVEIQDISKILELA